MREDESDGVADLFIIGGGVNGCGIARDAAGRGLKVILAEQGDLGQATSSASSKLLHGGLRYLEYFEFRLVREALSEREVLIGIMPHIARPMRFVLPISPAMRFDDSTPAARLIRLFLPWLRGRRPAWMIRAGLFLYDQLGRGSTLPRTRRLDLTRDAAGAPLKPEFRLAYEYSDGFVHDARLVALNARDAAERGARILTRTRVTRATREGGIWHITTADGGTHQARALVNAAGPWVDGVIRDIIGTRSSEHVRLVRGSHIVTRRLFDHERAYFLQGEDGRIIFAIPFEDDFTLIGTTDHDHQGAASEVRCTEEERDYLLAFAGRYFRRPLTPADVVWSFAGVRPLYDDGARSATAATRDYVLSLHVGEGAPLLNIFGGKITTYRRLAEVALARLAPHLPARGAPWTAHAPLPGGDFAPDGIAGLVAELRAGHPFLTRPWALRLVRHYGTDAARILGDAREAAQLGRNFGATLTEAELRWQIAHEFARTAEDVLWRRTHLGLRLSEGEASAVEAFMAAQVT